jgi:signal transduction histidine kinase
MNSAKICHRQNVEMGFAQLANSNLPKWYWENAFQTATYIKNQLPIKVLKNQSSFEKPIKNKIIISYVFLVVLVVLIYDNTIIIRLFFRLKTCIVFSLKNCIFVDYSL